MDIKVLVYNPELRIYKTEWTLDFAAIPQIGSKIKYKRPEEAEDAYVYEVVDLIYGDHKLVEIHTKCIGTVTEYDTRFL